MDAIDAKLERFELKAKCRDLTPSVIQRWEWMALGRADMLGVDEVPLKIQKEAGELLVAYGYGRPAVSIDVTTRNKIRTLPAPPPKPSELPDAAIATVVEDTNGR